MERVGCSNMKFRILFYFLFLYSFVSWVSSQEDETLKVLKSKKLSELQAILSKVLDTVNETEEVTTRDPRLTGDPRKDYIYDPNLPRELGDHNLSTYPFYNEVPKDITFKCDGKLDGYYASVPHHCQLFHLCVFGHRHDFLCANYTVFDQSQFICHFVNAVNCSNSLNHYERNSILYVTTTTTIEPPEEEYDDYEVRPKRRRRPKNGRRRGQRRRTTTTTLSPDEYYYEDEELPEEGAEQPEPATTEKARRPALRPPKPILRTATKAPSGPPLAIEPIPLKTIPFPVRRPPPKEDPETPADEPLAEDPLPAKPIPVRRSQSRVKTEPPPVEPSDVEPLEADPIPVKAVQVPVRRSQARQNAESSAVDPVAVQPIAAQRIPARRSQVSAKPADEEPLPVQRIPARRFQAKQNADPPAASEPLEEDPIPVQRTPARRAQSSARVDDEPVDADPAPVQRTPARRLVTRVRTPVIAEAEFAEESKVVVTKVKMFHDPMSVINPDIVVGNILAGVGAVPSTTLPPTTVDPLEYEDESSDEPTSDSEEPKSGTKRKRKQKVTTTAAPHDPMTALRPEFVVGSILSGAGAVPTTTVPTTTTAKRIIIRGRTRTPPVTTVPKIETTPLEAPKRADETPSAAASISELTETTSSTQKSRLVKRIRKPGGRTTSTTTTTLAPGPIVDYEYSE